MKSFNERCYGLLKKVPRGKVTTYKILAEKLGTRAYRTVGNAMNKNPDVGGKIPCHRVVNSNGGLGGFALGKKVKEEMLEAEGVFVRENKIVDFEDKLFRF